MTLSTNLTMNVRLTVDGRTVRLWRLKLLGYCAQLLAIPIEPHFTELPKFRDADVRILRDIADDAPELSFYYRHVLRHIAAKIAASLPVTL